MCHNVIIERLVYSTRPSKNTLSKDPASYTVQRLNYLQRYNERVIRQLEM